MGGGGRESACVSVRVSVRVCDGVRKVGACGGGVRGRVRVCECVRVCVCDRVRKVGVGGGVRVRV